MSRPDIPKSPVPMLTEVVQINGSLRPAVLPWASTQETVDSALAGLPDQGRAHQGTYSQTSVALVYVSSIYSQMSLSQYM